MGPPIPLSIPPTSPPSRPLRIAILEADTPLPLTHAKYNGYGGVFRAFLETGAESLGWKPERDLRIERWDVVSVRGVQVGEYPRVEDVDAVLVTGSRQSAFENFPWIERLVSFVQALIFEQTRVRLIGVCFGHQIIGRALGHRIVRNSVNALGSTAGWEVSVCKVQLTEKGKEIFEGKSILNIFHMHKDIISPSPPPTSSLPSPPSTPLSLGSSPACSSQGLYLPRRLITLQAHPESTSAIVSEQLTVRHQMGIFSEEQYREGISRVQKEQDGPVVARAFLRFLVG